MSRLFAFSDENRVSKNILDQSGITSISVVEETSDGGLLIAGSITNYGGVVGRNVLIKVTQDGIVDNEFTTNASDGTKFNSSILVIKELSDNSVLIGGSFTNYSGITNLSYFIKLNSDGTLNNSFIANACGQNKFNSSVRTIEEQPDGKIVVGGFFTNYGGRYGRDSVIRLNSDGTLDTTFNGVIDGPIVSSTNIPIIITSGSAIATLGSGISAISAVGTTTTITTSVNHNFVANESVVISGVTQSGGTTINGTKTIVSVTTNQIVISTPTTPTGIGFSSGLVKKTNFNNVSIGSRCAASGVSVTYIKDLYVDSAGDRKIVFNVNASSSGTVLLDQYGKYQFEVGTVSGSNVVSAKYQRFFNSRIKTISGDSYIYFPLEDDTDTDPSRYFGPKKVFCSAFPNGTVLNYTKSQWGTGYVGIETIDNIKYHKFLESGATTTSEEFCLISQAETWTAISGNKLQIGETGFDLRPYSNYLRIGQPVYTENGSTSGPWGAGVSTATITAIENTQISLPGFPYVATVVNIQTSPAVTSTSGNFALNFGQYSIPYTTKVNELFTPSSNFTSNSDFAGQKRIWVGSVTSGDTSTFNSAQAATSTGTITLTSNVKFFNSLYNVKYSSIDNSLLFAGGFIYDDIAVLFSNSTDLMKFSLSGVVDRNFYNASPIFEDGSAISTIPFISSVDIDSAGNIFVAGDLTIKDNFSLSIITGLVKIDYLGNLDNTFLSNVENKFGNSTTGNPTNSKGAISFVSIQKNGFDSDYKVLASGCFKSTGYDNTSGRHYIVRLNSNGTIDNDFCTTLIDNKLSSGYNPALSADRKEIARALASNLSNNIYIFGLVNNTYFKQYNEYDLVLNKV